MSAEAALGRSPFDRFAAFRTSPLIIIHRMGLPEKVYLIVYHPRGLSNQTKELIVDHGLVTMVIMYGSSCVMSLRQNLATNLRHIRAKREMSQDDFAALIDIHRTYLNHLEGAKRSPTIDVIEKIAERLEVPITDLLGDPAKDA